LYFQKFQFAFPLLDAPGLYIDELQHNDFVNKPTVRAFARAAHDGRSALSYARVEVKLG
jgi:hypothetical protein